MDYDIVIVGGGIAGASLGAEIAGKRRTLIIEAEAHCGYHSTGRSAAFWLESYGGEQVALLTSAARSTFQEETGPKSRRTSPPGESRATNWRRWFRASGPTGSKRCSSRDAR